MRLETVRCDVVRVYFGIQVRRASSPSGGACTLHRESAAEKTSQRREIFGLDVLAVHGSDSLQDRRSDCSVESFKNEVGWIATNQIAILAVWVGNSGAASLREWAADTLETRMVLR